MIDTCQIDGLVQDCRISSALAIEIILLLYLISVLSYSTDTMSALSK